jgi:hypothetical protein
MSTETLNYPPPNTAPVSSSAGRTGAVIGGGILATVGSVLALAGGGILAVGGSDGTLTTGHHEVSTPTTALVSEVATINDTNELTDVLGEARVRINADADGNQPVFVGVGRKADVDRYLAGAEIDRVTDIDTDPFTLDKQRMSGDAHPKPPATQSFWVAKSSGTTANLDWKVRDGNYRVVVMNADGSRGVATQSQFEVEIPHLATIATVMLILGLVTIGGGIALIAPSLRSQSSSVKPQAGQQQYAIG